MSDVFKMLREASLAAAAVASGLVFACGGDATASAPPASGEPDAEAPSETTCPVVASTASPGKVGSDGIDEISGIVVSTRNEGVYWVHNDSGGSANAFALGADGKLLTTLTFDTASPVDIEDMAIDDGDGDASHLYFGDIGDNDLERDEIVIHRVAEPKLDGSADLGATSEKMRVTYADGAHNAETLLFDPTTKDLLIATKDAAGTSAIHRVGAFRANAKVTTEKIATVSVTLATGGDISRDGRLIALRNYTEKAFVWTREPAESLAAALARPPCEIPVASEKQGEAFAFLPGNAGTVTVSEGKSPALHVSLFR